MSEYQTHAWHNKSGSTAIVSERDGVVEISIELLEKLLTDLGYDKADDAQLRV